MRYVAFDLGDKRTGVAVGDDQTGLVSPAGVIQTPLSEAGGEALLRAVDGVIAEHLGATGSRGEIVVGLPANMDGTEGPRAALIRQWVQRIASRTGRTVYVQDERLTSSAADWTMARSGLTHQQKKERRDALAAAAILSDFLAARARAAQTGPEAGTS
jgi:putative Holliday junction resolvase